MPKVWNKNDPRLPSDAIFVDRPTKWGNPFSRHPETPDRFRVSKHIEAVVRFREWLRETSEGQRVVAMARAELKGKDLACWCQPRKRPCHAGVLLEVANT